ncbi:hypothetical protein [Amycolatopsis samaneae]|uniref:Secreted protein n=1 Tax=Amycolatopsis samaneae TaxID=664691 RepID=A0ABW5GSB2_9PSEU
MGALVLSGVLGAGTVTAAPTKAGVGSQQALAPATSPYSVGVDSSTWGSTYLAPGAESSWWYTWEFDDHHWSRMSGLPKDDGPPEAALQMVWEWANKGKIWVNWRANGGPGWSVTFTPTALVAPAKFSPAPRTPRSPDATITRIEAVYDDQGTIVSAYAIPSWAGEPGAPQCGATAREGQSVATLDVPAAYARRSLADIANAFHVDGAARALVLR